MLTAIHIENFKGFGPKSQRIQLAPITLLFGANSAGKTSFFHALFYLREIFETSRALPSQMSFFSDTIELGGFGNVVHNHDISKLLRFRLDFSVDKIDSDSGISITPRFSDRRRAESKGNFYFGVSEISIELTIAYHDSHRAFVKTFAVYFEDKRIVELDASLNNVKGYWDIEVKFDFDNIADTHVAPPDDQHSPWTTMYRFPGAIPRPQDPILSSCSYRGDRRVSDDEGEIEFARDIDELLIASVELACKCLNDLLYIGPVRSIPSSEFSAQLRPARSRWSSGLAGWDSLHFVSSRELQLVNEWLGPGRLDTGFAIDQQQPIPLSSISSIIPSSITPRLRLRPIVGNSEEYSPACLRVQDVGFGISQVVPVIAALLVAEQNCVVIEQPEIHLHPRLQTVLGDLLIFSCVGEEKKRTIIETHSEHLILRILRRIRESTEGELPPGIDIVHPYDIAVNYFDQIHGSTKVSELRINDEGEFVDTWPKGFFDERIGELYG